MAESEFYIGETQNIRCSVTDSDGRVNVMWESDGTASPFEMQRCQQLVGAKLEAKLGPLAENSEPVARSYCPRPKLLAPEDLLLFPSTRAIRDNKVQSQLPHTQKSRASLAFVSFFFRGFFRCDELNHIDSG